MGVSTIQRMESLRSFVLLAHILQSTFLRTGDLFRGTQSELSVYSFNISTNYFHPGFSSINRSGLMRIFASNDVRYHHMRKTLSLARVLRMLLHGSHTKRTFKAG